MGVVALENRLSPVPHSVAQTGSHYSDLHQVPGVETRYDAGIYAPGSYDSFISQLQENFVRRTFAIIAREQGHVKHLDFACGTGRVLSMVRNRATESIGV